MTSTSDNLMPKPAKPQRDGKTLLQRIQGFLLWLIVILVVLIGLAVGGIYLYWHKALPEYEGHARLKGLTSSVNVIRDQHGVPHIFAANQADALRSLGYIHASERMFQMELNRRAGQGRLAEIFGKDLLSVDKFIRTLGLYGLAQSSFKTFSPEAKASFQAYAEGINEWIENHPYSLSPEFLLLGIKPEPWQPADSVVWGKLMALQLSKNMDLEILRAKLEGKLTPEQIGQIFPNNAGDTPVTINPQVGLHGEAAPSQDPLTKLGEITSLAHAASNEWVISGKRTASKKPILANDPHLSLEAPILWYLVRIVLPDSELKGASVPGLPIVLLGQNDHIAWGFTTTGSDVQDLFIETLDKTQPDHYLTPQGSAAFTAHTETIHVKGEADVQLLVRTSRHGPVLSDIKPELAELAGKDKVMALQFTGLDGEDSTAEALLNLNHAANWKEFLAALKPYQAPTQNLVYADRDGNIGFINPGRVPVRFSGNGRAPADGASGKFDWRGYTPFSYLPQSYNPEAGFIFNANNAVATPAYPYWLGADWEESWRAERLQQFFNTTQQHDLKTSAAMQNDHLSLPAREMLPRLTALKPSPQQKPLSDMIYLLHRWDGVMDQNKAEPLIFDAWLYFMNQRLFGKFGGLNEKGALKANLVSSLVAEEKSAWCDGKPEAGTMPCDQTMLAALQDAYNWIVARQGPEINSWRWGKEHRAILTHKVFSHLPLLKTLTDLSVPSSGDFYTLDRGGSFDMKTPDMFTRTHGGGYRAVYDLADPDKSRFMITTGESGLIFAPHYGDLVNLWNSGQSITIGGSAVDVLKNGGYELQLTP